ncbi:Bax inhibitor-1 family protein [Entomomonas sp. E2T0]|uniref:Bax inhibitor-1 family protein n=1 Tax=Entomomonas sp. E2T0 TaxID=2930213 RepID=UPI0022284E11|nr:Bax inhibitor-1 family protein [Entomomonas sp. E2T0]UYZ85525.1 Bax inhibitor-1 family protein [Entomomonas sp. E2T0]
MASDNYVMEHASQLLVSKVLRNTYALLALTLTFSAICCLIAMAANFRQLNIFVFFAGAWGLMFLTTKLRNSIWGLASLFAFTGFMGFSIAPAINYYLYLPNGANIVFTAFALTAFAFFGLSAFVLITRKDMSFLGNFIVVGAFIILGAIALFFIAPLFGYYIPGLSLAISAGIILISAAGILWKTSAIVHGGETNYIMATMSLFMDIYFMFVHLLNILGIASND